MTETDDRVSRFTYVGTARCSEASPQCTNVGRAENGDVLLADHNGRKFVIPAAEVAQVLELAGRQR